MVYETGPWGQEDRFSVLKDWTSNGRFLAIKDVRRGKSALYLLPMTNGTATGRAAFVRYGEFDSAYTTASGRDQRYRPNVTLRAAKGTEIRVQEQFACLSSCRQNGFPE